MDKIIPMPNVLRTQPDVLQDSNQYAGEFQALGQLGQTIGAVGDMLGKLAEQRAQVKNQGDLMREDNERAQVIADIEAFKFANQTARPEIWQEFADDRWRTFNEGRDFRSKEFKWSPVVNQADVMKSSQDYAQWRVRMTVDLVKQETEVSNAEVIKNAQQELRKYNYKGFISRMEQLNMNPVQKEQAIEAGLQEGIYKNAEFEMDVIGSMLPVEQKEQYLKFMAELDETDENGNFVNYEYERGGLSAGGRSNLKQMAYSRLNAVYLNEALAHKAFINGVENGSTGLGDLDKLESSYGSTPTTQAMRQAITTKTTYDVNFQEAADDIQKDIEVRFLEKHWAFEPDAGRRDKILKSIAAMKSPVDTKLALFNEFLDSHINDFYNGKLDKHGWGGHKVNDDEYKIRLGLVRTYRETSRIGGERGLEHAARSFMVDNQKLIDFFSKPYTEEQLFQLRKELFTGAQSTHVGQLLNEAVGTSRATTGTARP